MPEAISDSSTLIHLAAIGRLDLLKGFYDEVIITPAVWKEVVLDGQLRPGSREVEEARNNGWIVVISPSNELIVKLLKRELHEGESETIALAVERQPEIVLLDEMEARRVTELYGLRVTGVIGILIRAKFEGEVSSLRHELDRLRDEGGFWIGEDLFDRALKAVKELD